jgi:hypothetical protein
MRQRTRTLSAPISSGIVTGVSRKVQHFIDKSLQHHEHVGTADHNYPHRRVASAGLSAATEDFIPCIRLHEAAATIWEVAETILLRSVLTLGEMALVTVAQTLESSLVLGLLWRALVKCVRERGSAVQPNNCKSHKYRIHLSGRNPSKQYISLVSVRCIR